MLQGLVSYELPLSGFYQLQNRLTDRNRQDLSFQDFFGDADNLNYNSSLFILSTIDSGELFMGTVIATPISIKTIPKDGFYGDGGN